MSLYKGTVPIAGLAKNTIVNGFHIFDCKWADHLLEDISWLRADQFSYHSGSVYVTAYNELVSEYNNASSTTETEGSITFKRTPKGYKIADATQETAILNKYNTDGIAWYYILDTANTRFKLPRTKFGFEGLRDTVGNDVGESLPNITGGWNRQTGNEGIIAVNDATLLDGAIYAGSETYSYSSGYYNRTGTSLKFNASRSSSTYQDGAPVQERATQMYLYFYVGEYSQTAIEQTAGITSEQLNAKVDVASLSTINPMITSYVNGTSGYNIWSNGYCEQWGKAGGATTITFSKVFKDTNYTILAIKNSGAIHYDPLSISSYTTTTATFVVYGNDAPFFWKASGYLAEGQY